MFWGCFSYDKKGPCHIWEEKTAEEKKEAKEWMNKINKELKPECYLEWEAATAICWLKLTHIMGGPKPKWKWCEKTDKLKRRAMHRGIDWYWYYCIILKKKLLPFVKECQCIHSETIVQEDNALSHAHKHQTKIYSLWKVMKLLWPANLPDLNAIEPCWFWMKRQTTRKGVASGVEQMRKDWINCWKRLPQSKIQEWIERIPENIQKIIACEGGNEYQKERRRNPQRVHQ